MDFVPREEFNSLRSAPPQIIQELVNQVPEVPKKNWFWQKEPVEEAPVEEIDLDEDIDLLRTVTTTTTTTVKDKAGNIIDSVTSNPDETVESFNWPGRPKDLKVVKSVVEPKTSILSNKSERDEAQWKPDNTEGEW
jgi:hypothetical protein